MRFYVDAAFEGQDGAWERCVAAYAAHIAEITPRLPPEVLALASDARLNLHDGHIQEVVVDLTEGRVVLNVTGRFRRQHRLLTLQFAQATIIPDNLQLLADVIGAEFRANHWHRRRMTSSIHAQEVDLAPDGRFLLRLRLWPLYEFAIDFATLSVAESSFSAEAPARAGRFTLLNRT